MARIVFTLEDGTEIETELDSDVITLGRHPDSHVVLPSASVSSQHATIKKRGEEFHLQDLGTTNGTKLNGVDIEEAKLSHGDQVALGDVPGIVYLKDAPVAKSASSKTPVQPQMAAKSVEVAKSGKAPARGSASAAKSRPVQYRDGIGCAGFFMLLIFLTVAFLVGICLRHYNETKGGFLPTDLINKLQQGEAPANEQKASDKGSDKKQGASP